MAKIKPEVINPAPVHVQSVQPVKPVQRISLRTAFMYFLRFLKVVVCLALMLNIAAYGLIIAGGILGDSLATLDRVFIILASFGYIFISVVLIIAEFGPMWFVENMKVFRYWGARGGMIAWQGVQTIYSVTQLAASLPSSGEENSKRIQITKISGQICGWFLIIIGLLYVSFSACCLHSIADLDKPVDDSVPPSNVMPLLPPMLPPPPPPQPSETPSPATPSPESPLSDGEEIEFL